MTRKQSYCCFDNTLAAIVQMQGRDQLRLSYGSAEAPDCRGLRIEELQRIDFGQLDFSNFTGDLYDQTTLPDAAAVRAELSQRIEAFYQQRQ